MLLCNRSFLDWRGRRQYCKSLAGSLPLPRELPLPSADEDEMPWPEVVRFYAGVPLLSADVVVGALSVLDSRADAQLSAAQQTLLRRLARQVVCLLELRRATAELGAGRAALLAAARDRDRLRSARDAKAREVLTLRWQFARHVGEDVAAPLHAVADAAHALALADTSPPRTAVDDIATRLTHLQLSVVEVLDAGGDEPMIAPQPADMRCSVLAPALLLARHTHGSVIAGGARLLRSVGHGVPPRVVCDAPRVVAVLCELLNNAIKHSPANGSGAVMLAARVEAGALCLSVSGDGQGIAADAFPALFSRGGLAKCAALAAAMDGELRAYSDGIDAGATFTLRLPLTVPPGPPEPPLPPEDRTLVGRIGTASASASAAAPPPQAAPPRLKPGQRSDGTPLRILVAEDDRVSQMIIRKLLVHVGATVTLVGDGNAAVAAWCAAPEAYDLLLLDMMMPGLDGPGAAKTLIEAGCRTPMVALTAHAGASAVRRCLDAGMVGHLSKPVRPETLSTLRPFAEGREPTQEDTDAMQDWMALEAAP